MHHFSEDGFEYLDLNTRLTPEQEAWLFENVGNQAHCIPPKPYQVLARWWFISKSDYKSVNNGLVFNGYLHILGFRNLNDAMMFKLTWAGA